MKYQIIGFTLGFLLVILGGAQMIPAALDWTDAHANADDFFYSGLLAIFLGGALCLSNKSFKADMGVRQTFMLTTLSWIVMSLAAAVPLYFSNLDISYTDAVFEAASGITTTGSTVLSGLDEMSRGVLIWRSLIQWIGGIGIVGFAIVILPFLNIGGMQLFQSESSDRSEKIMPRTYEVVSSLVLVYIGITALCIITYHALGMSWFDAINHALTTICTGGYSTHDASYGHFDSYALDMAGTFFMLLGGLPFVLYMKAIFKGKIAFMDDDQFKALMSMLAVFIGALAIWLWFNGFYSPADSLRYAAFNTISVITTTGYATTDYTLWGPFAVMFFFFLTYIGASAGSTAGGIKTMRLVIAAKALNRHVKQLIYPSGVFVLKYQGKPIDRTVITPVLGFLCLYVFSNVFFTLILTWMGLDFETALSGAATAIANVGPGIGEVIGPSGNFAPLPDAAKWVLSFAMILGRLEILTVAVIFSYTYWRS